MNVVVVIMPVVKTQLWNKTLFFRRKQHSTISEQILSDENAVFATPKSRQKKPKINLAILNRAS